MLYVPVHGTFTVPHEGTVWFEQGSDVHKAMVAAGHDFARLNDPFEWSGDLDGAFAGKRTHTDWAAAGRSLRYYLNDLPYKDRNLITHSHGLQVALYAASQGAKFRRLISITGPVREDMKGVAQAALPNVGPWLHVYCPTDMVQWAGSVCFDGHIDWPTRKHPLATNNLKVPKVGHSGLLSDTRYIPILIRDILPWAEPIAGA